MPDTMLCPHCKHAGAVIDGNVSKCGRCLYWMNLDEVRAIKARREWERQQWAQYQARIDERNRQYREALAAAAAAEAGLLPSVLRDIEAALGQGMTRPSMGTPDA